MDLKDKFGLSTDQGTNALALLLMVFQFGQEHVPLAHVETFSYLIVLAAIVVLWLTRGHEAVISNAVSVLQESSDDRR